MNKDTLVKKIVAQLVDLSELYANAARASHAEATDEQNQAENKYDTRGLEAAYLARGQSRQVAETEQALKQYQALSVRAYGAADPIDLGALVELETKTERSFYFVGPCAGGTEIVHDKKDVLVITPQSPLGQQLVGKKQGDRLKLQIAGTRNEYRVVSVC